MVLCLGADECPLPLCLISHNSNIFRLFRFGLFLSELLFSALASPRWKFMRLTFDLIWSFTLYGTRTVSPVNNYIQNRRAAECKNGTMILAQRDRTYEITPKRCRATRRTGYCRSRIGRNTRKDYIQAFRGTLQIWIAFSLPK